MRIIPLCGLLLASALTAREAVHPREPHGGMALRRALAVLAFASVIAIEAWQVREQAVLGVGERDKVYADASRWAETKIPPRSLMVSGEMSGAVRFYTNLVPVRWDRVEPAQLPILREHARARGYPWFALLLPSENEALEKRFPWGWTKVGTRREATLWRLDPGR